MAGVTPYRQTYNAGVAPLQYAPPASAQLWTPNFNGVDSYGLLDVAFAPTGAGTILTVRGVYLSNGAIQELLTPDGTVFDLRFTATSQLIYNLLSDVTVNGIATPAGTIIPDGYFELVGTLDATANIKTIAANQGLVDNFQTQVHLVGMNDPLDANNSLLINTIISSETMPVDTNLYNSLDATIVGSLVNLGAIEPYVIVEGV